MKCPHCHKEIEEEQNDLFGPLRVIRGGSWINDAQFLRSDFRTYGHPGNHRDFAGFRLVRSKK